MTMLRYRVILLDDTIIERHLEKKAVGQVLFDQVCENLNLLERDYFGLAAWDSFNNKVWLNFTKQVHKQIMGHDATFTFSVKFYPPDPSVLAEDITRYLLCLQLRADILSSRLPCPSDMLAVLGSYTIQSELGDYNPELHGKEFFTKIPLAPDQTPELEEKVTEIHQTLRSMSPAQADQLFLQNVKTLDMYGVHQHHAKDASGEDVMLGVCADGLVVYKNEEKTQSFIWPEVVNVSYKRRNFHARIFQSEDASENTITFILPSYHACKCLWRNAVEQHAFFRDLENAPERLLKLGSRFRFHGLTHAESLEVSATIRRPAPRFSRSAIKRKAKESLHVALKRPNLTEFHDWFLMLSSDESRPTYGQEKAKLTGQETLAYKGKREVDKLDNQWFELFDRRSFPTQHSFSSLSSDSDILESATFQLWKLQADDWFVLFEPRTYYPTYWPIKTLPLSLQMVQAEEQKEEMGWIEKNSGKRIKVVKIRKEFKAVTEQHEDLEMERQLVRADTTGEDLELDTRVNKKILKVMRETIEQNGDGEKVQKEVMYEQRTQDLEPYIGQSQEAFVEQTMRGVEVVETVHRLMLKTSETVSEENIEDLEKTLLEVESIGQRLQDIERLKVRLQEVEMLEQKLQEIQQAERRQEESDDWYILLEHKLMETSTLRSLLGAKTSEQKLQDIEQKRQEPGDRGDWYLLEDSVVSLVSAAGQKAENKQWIEEELQRANSLTPVQMKDDWYIMLELPKYTQIGQPALSSSEDTDIQSSLVEVGEEHKSLGKEIKWSEEKVVHMRETQPTLPAQRDEQRPKEVDDDWFIQLGVSPKNTDVYKDTREEDVQLVRRELKTITFEEEGGEMMERSHEVIQMNPTSLKKKGVPSVETAIQSSWVHVVEEHKNLDKGKKWPENTAVRVRDTQPTLPAQRDEQRPKEVDDDWFIQLNVSPKNTDVYKDTREEDVQLVRREIKTIAFEEEGGEMMERSHEVIQMNPISLKKKGVPSVETAIQSSWVHVVEEHKNLDKGKKWPENTAVRVRDTQPTLPAQRDEQRPKEVDDDWFIQLDVSPKNTVLAAAVNVYKETRRENVQLGEKEVKTITFGKERREIMETSHDRIETNVIPFEKRDVSSVHTTFISEYAAGLKPQQKVTIKEKEVNFDKKPVIKGKQEIVRGVEKKFPATTREDEDNWFVLFTPVQIERKSISTAGVSDSWILEEKRLMEVQKGRLEEDVKRSHVVEDRRRHPYVPEPKAKERHMVHDEIDEWFILLEPVSKKSVSVERRAEEDQHRKKEVFKKQVIGEDMKKVAGFKPPTILPTPSDHPMTSTPTVQYVHITRPTYQVESLKRLGITQDITQDIKQESKVETESIIVRKRREKRIEGESIFIRHSILMLEDSDVTQEILLKHQASISELKRHFMEDIPVYGPTEWDRRLSTYAPVIFPKLSNGELFTAIDIMRTDGLLAM